jgi:hypothetical protein
MERLEALLGAEAPLALSATANDTISIKSLLVTRPTKDGRTRRASDENNT